LADHSSIFTVAAVVLPKVVVLALIDEVFSSGAHHFVQPDVASSTAKTNEINRMIMHGVIL
jgi:hypothetical protein